MGLACWKGQLYSILNVQEHTILHCEWSMMATGRWERDPILVHYIAIVLYSKHVKTGS